MKLPQAPNPSSEKGTAMHEAMDNVWKIENRMDLFKAGKLATKIEEVIKDTVAEYLKTSFLATSEKESVKKELFENAPDVAKALETHFNQKGPVFTERWVKTVFNGRFVGGESGVQIMIPIHGKLDAIVEDGNDVNVFDYKTKQAMSEAEIKGETKNGTGDYFRQLAFYKLLLAEDPKWRTRRIVPALVFISPDKKSRCPIITLPIENSDIDNIKKSIQDLIDAVWGGEIVTTHCGDEKCEWCALKELRNR